jgi:class 3 adenylate cyclase
MRRVIVRRHARPSRVRRAPVVSKASRLLDNETLKGFSPAILRLGDISAPSREVEAIAAVFDLAGFTRFCNQVDPHLAVPKYLSSFLDWLFEKVKVELTARSYVDSKELWADLPFLAKFLGDGILFLWNTRNMNETLICNIIATLYNICYEYRHQFYPEIKMAVDKPPTTLRCGLARGRVFSVGNGQDYIGHCINTASRLQKLSLLTFCFPHRGFNIQGYMRENYRRLFIQKSVSIRGVGENELVWVLEEEFNKLPEKIKALFQNP